MLARELRDLSAEELRSRLQELREQLFKLRFQKTTGQVENPARLTTMRREIARVMTVQRERQSLESDVGTTVPQT